MKKVLYVLPVMFWKCPDCGKEFKNKHQWHSCAIVDVEEHIKNATLPLQAAYSKVMKAVATWNNITLNPVKSGIQVKCVATFLSFAFKKDALKIEFYYNSIIVDSAIINTKKLSKNRIVHCVFVKSSKDVNTQLMKWIRASYDLVNV